jgi:hypothetical protein
VRAMIINGKRHCDYCHREIVKPSDGMGESFVEFRIYGTSGFEPGDYEAYHCRSAHDCFHAKYREEAAQKAS